MKWFRSIETEKLLVTIVVSKAQSLTLLLKRRDIQLKPYTARKSQFLHKIPNWFELSYG